MLWTKASVETAEYIYEKGVERRLGLDQHGNNEKLASKVSNFEPLVLFSLWGKFYKTPVFRKNAV